MLTAVTFYIFILYCIIQFFFIFLSVVTVYVWIVFYSYYRQLEDEKASVSAYRVVHYSHQNVNEDETVQNSVDPIEFHSTSNNDLQKIVL